MSKNILMITSDFNRQCGVESVMLNLGRELLNKGHKVHILSASPIINRESGLSSNIKLHEIKIPKLVYKLFLENSLLFNIYKIIKVTLLKSSIKKIICKEGNFDLVLSELAFPKFSFPKQIQNKLYIWIHNDEGIRRNNAFKKAYSHLDYLAIN